jgi:hypothetical protein
MRIAFYVIGNSRRSNTLDGYNIRYGGASASGTDTSAILVAEYLAQQGHEVVFAGEFTSQGKTVHGVTYTNLLFEDIDNKTFDVLISMLWVENYHELPITITQGVVYWSHMQWAYGLNTLQNFCQQHQLKMSVVHISQWESQQTSHHVQFLHQQYPIIEDLIPNPVSLDIVDEVRALNLERKKEKFVFHATWARGGRIAYDVVDMLPWDNKEIHVFDYLMNISINWGHTKRISEPPPFLVGHGGSDKITIFKHLAESKYFIYPLYTPYQDVHKDTFSCVVAEAIAMGCIVLTYPLGAVPEYFNNHCCWIDVPEGFDVEKMQKESLTKDLEGKFINPTVFHDKIEMLENDIEEQEKYLNGGYEYIKNNFSIDVIGTKWLNHLNLLVSEIEP